AEIPVLFPWKARQCGDYGSTLALNGDLLLAPAGVVRVDVFVENFEEFLNDLVAAQGGQQPPSDVNRSFGLFEGSRKRDAEICVFCLSWAVDHAAHYRNFHLFNTGVALFPDGHLLAQIALNLLGHFLEESAGGAAAARAGRHLRHEATNSEGLENLL